MEAPVSRAPVEGRAPEKLFSDGLELPAGLAFEGRADAAFARNRLRNLNRDYLVAQDDAGREACRRNSESFLCALEPGLRGEILGRRRY